MEPNEKRGQTYEELQLAQARSDAETWKFFTIAAVIVVVFLLAIKMGLL